MRKILRSNKVKSSSNDDLDTSTQDDKVCLPSKCLDDRKKDKLICEICHRHVHYVCSELPAYYIQLIQDKNNNITFTCKNCVNVTKQVGDKCTSWLETTTALKRDVANCENIIKIKEEKEKELKTQVDTLQKEIKDLKKKLKNDPALHTVEYMEDKFEKKIKEMGEEIRTSIVGELKSILPAKQSNTYAEAASSCKKSMKTIIVEARNEEHAEDEDRKRRAANIIIHGVLEPEKNGDTPENEQDMRYVDQLVKDLHIHVSTKKILQVSRIGKSATDKIRPIKVIMANEESKRKIFKNLSNLKQYPKYKGIGLTDDHTPAEREVLKEWTAKAKERNEKENDNSIIWRVRGSPKNKLYLKKFPKNQ